MRVLSNNWTSYYTPVSNDVDICVILIMKCTTLVFWHYREHIWFRAWWKNLNVKTGCAYVNVSIILYILTHESVLNVNVNICIKNVSNIGKEEGIIITSVCPSNHTHIYIYICVYMCVISNIYSTLFLTICVSI